MLVQILEPYKELIESELTSYIKKMGEKTLLRDACEYALKNGGKRFRPALVLMIAKALRQEADVTQAALAVEFFHTASLIADDLPCMDNDDTRRNKPSTHKIYGESVALLSTYALISEGYALIAKNSKNSEICRLAIENASHNTGIQGATGGQFLDLIPPNLSFETLKTIIQKKTATLFEISFVFGWLFGGGEVNKLPLVKKASHHFGMAFQIADDLGDMEQDKINGRAINLANVCGKEQAIEMFHGEISSFKKLNLYSEDLESLIQILSDSILIK